MSVPNDRHIVEAVYNDGDYDLDTHEGLADFVDAAVAALHAHDENWVHIKKKSGQKNIHGHAEDAALYLLPNNKAQGCDFVQGAGASGAKVRWGPDAEPFYTHADGWDPHKDWSEDEEEEPPPPVVKPYPGDAYFTDQIGVVLENDYREAGQSLNAGSATWFARTIWRHVNEGMPMDQSVAQSRKEWRAALGLPPPAIHR